jgi:hypothetical protein
MSSALCRLLLDWEGAVRARLENDDLDDGAVGGEAHVTDQSGRDAQQVVVSVRVLFVDPKSYGILVTRFTSLDQVAKPNVVDATFLLSVVAHG